MYPFDITGCKVPLSFSIDIRAGIPVCYVPVTGEESIIGKKFSPVYILVFRNNLLVPNGLKSV